MNKPDEVKNWQAERAKYPKDGPDAAGEEVTGGLPGGGQSEPFFVTSDSPKRPEKNPEFS